MNQEQRRRRFATYAWLVLGVTMGVILWGAFVRATGSGAGCGSHWPLCNGEVLPRAPQIETLIEFVHRLTSGLAGLLVLGLVLWAWRIFERGHLVRISAGAAGFFLLTEALIGAGLVRFELVAGNSSPARGAVVALHLANTFILLAALVLSARWGAQDRPRLLWRERWSRSVWLFLGLAGMLLLGISGAVTALGDTLFPVDSLAQGLQQDLSPGAHLFIRLRVLHPALAVLVGGGLIAMVRWTPVSGAVPLAGHAVIVLVILQWVAGALNVALLAPVWMQIVHLLLADLIWIACVLYVADVLADQPQAQPQAQVLFESQPS